ncbi:MAG: hypothetical protein COA62_01680 [Rhodobiaceae bacterium]|nr:MAG: hypothetical protein COA62_01680 [Rhodobiaceae bacterium]
MQEVAAIIGEELSCDPAAIELATAADDIDGWDSLAHARLILRIETDLNLRFPGNKLFDLGCVGDIVSLVDDCRTSPEQTNAL